MTIPFNYMVLGKPLTFLAHMYFLQNESMEIDDL